MKYLYHLKPEPFEGSFLIPLNLMNKSSSVYLNHAKKYEGREELMLEIIPKLNCKWNDVIQLSAINPQFIARKLKEINPELKLIRAEYFKIPVEKIVPKYEAVIYKKNPSQVKGDFSIHENDIEFLTTSSYKELIEVPTQTINYWLDVKKDGGKFLWFPFIPHIFVKGIIETSDFELCTLTL
ncbi:MAG: hypothetical protein H7336_17065 [Bacteriovorax sp.]|nr:hypothetical protein [Bacteriovorax sp.]